jgi:hypothetical protein
MVEATHSLCITEEPARYVPLFLLSLSSPYYALQKIGDHPLLAKK